VISTAAAIGAPRRGWRWLRVLGEWMLRAMRWRLVGAVPDIPRFVAIVAPHSTNWDFPVGVAAMFALDLRVHWFGKDTLFRGPLGVALRAIGGRPVKRESAEGVVREVAAALQSEPQFILALAPEGTRKPVAKWRTGFYHIAHEAQVPVVPVRLDWSRREIGIGAPVFTCGDVESDVALLRSGYRREMAKYPDNFLEQVGPVTLE
jgi:1-acyl-sn-glycerol-3-phosphate acyltransferase